MITCLDKHNSVKVKKRLLKDYKGLIEYLIAEEDLKILKANVLLFLVT